MVLGGGGGSKGGGKPGPARNDHGRGTPPDEPPEEGNDEDPIYNKTMTEAMQNAPMLPDLSVNIGGGATAPAENIPSNIVDTDDQDIERHPGLTHEQFVNYVDITGEIRDPTSPTADSASPFSFQLGSFEFQPPSPLIIGLIGAAFVAQYYYNRNK